MESLCPAVDKWIKKVCIYAMEYYLVLKKGNSTIYNNIDELTGCDTEWSKPDAGKQMLWSHLHVESKNIECRNREQKASERNGKILVKRYKVLVMT